MKYLLATVFALSCGPTLAAGAINADVNDDPYVWDLTDLYETDEDWNAALEEILAELEEMRVLKGTLSDGPQALLTAFETVNEKTRKATRVFQYASLGADENLGNPTGQERRQQAQRMFSEFTQATSWMQPELIAAGREVIESYVKEDARLAPFAFQIDNALRNAPHDSARIFFDGHGVKGDFVFALAKLVRPHQVDK